MTRMLKELGDSLKKAGKPVASSMDSPPQDLLRCILLLISLTESHIGSFLPQVRGRFCCMAHPPENLQQLMQRVRRLCFHSRAEQCLICRWSCIALTQQAVPPFADDGAVGQRIACRYSHGSQVSGFGGVACAGASPDAARPRPAVQHAEPGVKAFASV